MAFSLRSWSLHMDNWHDLCLLSSNCKFLILYFWNNSKKSYHPLWLSDDYEAGKYVQILSPLYLFIFFFIFPWVEYLVDCHMIYKVERWMEKLEEAEIKRRVSIKAAVVLICSLVLYFFNSIIILVYLYSVLFDGPDHLSWFLGWLFMVWAYIQAGQAFIQ